MGMFNKIKGAKEMADKHKAVQQEKEQEDVTKPRYVHTPRHAARDAMGAAPAGWKGNDRELIAEANRARISRASSYNESYYGYHAPNWAPPNPKLPRSSSGLSMGEWSAASSSMGSMSPSWHKMHQGPPVPTIPAQYASQSNSPLIGSPRSESRNSDFFSAAQVNGSMTKARSSMIQSSRASPLGQSSSNSHGPSSVDSDHSSTASSHTSQDLEIQVVRPSSYTHQGYYPAQYQTSPQLSHGFSTPRPERKYFAHSTVTPVAQPKATPVPAVAPKKSRFSFMKKSPAAIAAH